MSNHSTRTQPANRRRNATKIAASVALVGAAAAVAGLGTFGSFTSTTSATESVSNGRVEIALSQHGTLGTSVAATNMVPGDTVQRALTLTRSAATETFGSVKLTSTASTSNLLTTDAANGLKLKIDQCDSAWTKEAGNTLSCATTPTVVFAQSAVLTTNTDLAAATAALNATGAAANLRLTLELPTGAGNTFQGLSNVFTFTFDATQRAAQAR